MSALEASGSSVALGEDFPLVCESCLGSNVYVRMTREPNAVLCRMTQRPCTQFRWNVGGGNYRTTTISYVYASQKNLCQCCGMDLTLGLPPFLRDAFMKTRGKLSSAASNNLADRLETLPVSRVGQDYLLNQQLALLQSSGSRGVDVTAAANFQALTQGAERHLASSSRTDPFLGSSLRLPDVCLEWLEKGSCAKLMRDESCPLRPCCGAIAFPELDTVRRDRLETKLRGLPNKRAYASIGGPGLAGVLGPKSGPVVAELIEKVKEKMAQNELKNEEAKCTVYVTDIPSAGLNEETLRAAFAAHGPVARISVLKDKASAFVEFHKLSHASSALKSSVHVTGSQVKVKMAKRKSDTAAVGGEVRKTSEVSTTVYAPAAAVPAKRAKRTASPPPARPAPSPAEKRGPIVDKSVPPGLKPGEAWPLLSEEIEAVFKAYR